MEDKKLDTLLADDFLAHQFTEKQLHKQEFISLIKRLHIAFPYGQMQFQSEKDKMTVEFTGKHSGNLDLNLENIGYYTPTGKEIKITADAKIESNSGQVSALFWLGKPPFIDSIMKKLWLRKQAWQSKVYVPPGHYYSPIPNMKEIHQNLNKIFAEDPMLGVNLREEKQLELLKTFLPYYKELKFPIEKSNQYRYYYNNVWYVYAEAMTLNFFLRHYKPKQVIEVGSGYSTGVMLDTNEKFLNHTIKIQCIEPYPDRLKRLVRKTDNFKLYEKNLQDINLSLFQSLQENDVLFIDSTHVSRTNSDVNYVIHHILPNLQKGVLIHFHDIYYQFEYPKVWVLENRAWNESYILRAFLQYNSCFEVVLWNPYVGEKYKGWLRKNMPLFRRGNGGAIWLRKTCSK